MSRERVAVVAAVLVALSVAAGAVPLAAGQSADAAVAAQSADAAVAAQSLDASADAQSLDASAAAQSTNDSAGAIVAGGVGAGGESLGSPVEADGTFDRRFYVRLSSLSRAYNEANPTLGPGSRLLTGNVVNLHVVDGEEEAVVSFRLTEENRITDLRAGAREDARVRLTTDRETFDRIAGADSPGAAFRDALESGEIRIDGRGPFSSAVWTVVNLLRGLVGLA